MSNEAAVASAGDVTLQRIIDGEATVNDLIGLGEPQVQAIAVLGFQAYEQGRAEEAKTIFEGLTALDSKSYFGYAGLGAMALADGDLDAAVENLNQAIERNSNDPSVYANLGEALMRKGDVEGGAAAFQTALELDPDGADPGANRARAMLRGISLVLEEAEKIAD